MGAGIPSPAEPAPTAPGQPASPVAPIVPGQYSSSTYSGAGIGMVPGAGIGNDTSDYAAQIKKDLFARLGITPYQPNPLTHYLLKPDYQDDTGGWKQGSPPVADQWGGVPDQGAGQVGGIAGPRISGPSDLDFWLRPFSHGMRGASLQRALVGGFDDSLIGAGFSWKEMHEAIGDVSDPDYDPFRDRQIKDAGMTNQMSLFYGSQGREQTRWLINHIKEKQRETEWSAGNSGVEQGLAFMGGILGDPSTVLPGNLGVKSFAIANKARQALASGNELRLVTAAHAAYGAMGDAVRTSAIQAGVMIAERALTNSLDPTIPGDVSSDLILPSVIAGSLGLIQGAAGRYAGRRLALQVHDADFLKPTPPPEPGPIRSWFGQPVVDTVAERVRGLKEKVEAIPELLREKAKEGAKDIAMQDIVGPPQTPLSNGGNFPAGSLATSYGPMRTREHLQSPAGTAFGDPHISTVGRIDHELPAAASGSRELVLNGQSRSAAEFPEGHQIMTPAGESWQVTPIAGVKRFVRAGDMVDEAKPVSPITANNHWLDERGKPVATTPGVPISPTAESRKAMSEIFSKDEGMTRLSPKDLSPGMVGGKRGFEESLVITPDGQLWHLNQKSFELAKEQTDSVVGQHNILGLRYGGQTDSLVRVTTYGDEIAADAAKAGNTPQQTAALRRIENTWEREGKADKARLGIDEAPKAPPEVAPNASEGAHQPGSVGAQLSPESLAYQESVLRAQGRLVPTGIGLENMPLNPIMRAFQGASVSAMRFAADVASTGGLITRGNAEGIANLAPVETLFQVNWNKRLVDTLRYQQDQWSAYRHKVAGAADFRPEDVNIEQKPDWKRTGEQIGEALKDRFSPGDRGLSFEQFRIRVAEAQNHGDRDLTNDAASPYVNASAAKFRSDIYDHARKRAQETGVFDEVYQASLDQAHADINAIEKEIKDMGVKSHVEKWTPEQRRLAEEALMARQEDAEFKYAQQKKQLDALRDHGPLLNGTAESYRPRLWDTGKLIDNEQDFFDKVVPWFQSKAGGALDLTEAVRITKQIHETLSHQNPIFDRGDMKALFQSVAGPTSAHARSFTIPDELVKDFLVNDSETLARYHVQQMGKAIEFKERFGSLDAKEQIAEIEQDYRRQIIEANKGATEATPEAIKLAAQMKTAIEDAQALRDKFYGTYGASPDPHRWDSRTIRMAKQFNNLTMLGMSGISALGDLMRPVMTEGIDAVYGYGIRSLMSESRALIMKMNKQELELEGNGMELQMNVRAMAAADTGDVFGSRGRFEHGLNQANAWNFVANGLNGVNQIDKEWARLSIGGRVNNILLDLSAGIVTPSARLAHFSDDQLADLIKQSEPQIRRMENAAADMRNAPDARAHYRDQANTLRSGIVEYQGELDVRSGNVPSGARISELDRGRFAAAGIGEDEARRIGLQIKIHGKDFGNITMPNTTAWTDDYARDVYRSAMNQFVNRTVPTPGIGDRPNWASTEWGGLISQYKSFGMGSLIRGGISGLQEGGNRFWYGAGAAVGFAILLNEVRSQLFYGKSTFDKPAPAVIVDGIDRSGILGWFSDVNRAVETLSGHRLGVKPMLGAEQPTTPTLPQIAGTLGGPTAGQAGRVVSIANDYLSGHPTAQTMRNWRALTPGGTNPVLDPVFDRVMPGTYPKRGAKPAPQPAGGG